MLLKVPFTPVFSVSVLFIYGGGGRRLGKTVFLRLNFDPVHHVIEREWFSCCPERVLTMAFMYLVCSLGPYLNICIP